MRGSARDLALVGIVAALSVVLGMFSWTLPSAGRISLAGVPILLLALNRGWRVGVAAGALAGALHFVQQPIAAHPVSILLDYPVASGALGLAGLLPPTLSGAGLGVLLAVMVKFAVHVVSGVIFWGQGQSGAAAWITSVGINLLYMLPQLVLDLACVVPLVRRLPIRHNSVR